MKAAVGGELRGGQDLAEALDFGFGWADDEHIVAVSDRVELIANPGDIAAEAFDRFKRQVAVCSGGASLNLSRGYHGKAAARCQHLRQGVEIWGRLGAEEVAFALVRDSLGIDEHDPRRGGQVVGEEAGGRWAGG